MARANRGLRELLLARAEGRCQRCGVEIALDTMYAAEAMHAAHLRSASQGGVVHESNLEAWCARCNWLVGPRSVGDPRVAPRDWQLLALDAVVPAIMRTRAATVSAAPGSGKTILASLTFEALRDADLVDRMLVLVPNRNLVVQWADALTAARHVQLKPNAAIERTGQHGAVVTYQSLQNRDMLEAHRLQCERRRTLLVPDEVHHLGRPPNGPLPAWARNVQELAGDVEAHTLNVAAVLNLSGTLWRSPAGERISTVRYRTVDDHRLETLVDFEVTVGELVAAGQLRPLDLYRLGARVRIADYENLEYVEGDLSNLDERPARAALASLGRISEWRTAFVAALLDRLRKAHEALDGYHAKALIVAASQEDATRFRDEVDRQMRERGLSPLAELAISDEPEAQRALERFREQRRVGVLCTVDMAGEGYDCPEIAVIGYASRKLTALYVRQVMARAMRVTARERELGRVIPAAVVLPDAPALVEQLVAYLSPFTPELTLPEEQLAEVRAERERGEQASFAFPRFALEDAHVADDETITIAYADGTREDVSGAYSRKWELELERALVPGIYAPRVIAATRRTVGDALRERPFEQPATSLERLFDPGPRAERPSERRPPATIEEQAKILATQVDRMAGWCHAKNVMPAPHFNRTVNQAGGIEDGRRGSASIAQLLRARGAGREIIAAYLRRTDTQPPRWWRDLTDEQAQ
jgi:superfamily II DNA or RNA helicase